MIGPEGGNELPADGRTETGKLSPELLARLTRAATDAAQAAYAPYSGFKVGAAVFCPDGRVFTGANVENATFPAGVCAERVAMASAVSQGERDFQAMVVVFADPSATSSGSSLVPCGICLQWVAELAPGITIHIPATGRVFTMSDLLPFAFRLTT